MRCYGPSTSTVVGLLFVGFLAFRHSAEHALAGVGLVTSLVIVTGICLLAGGLIVIGAAAIRRRRAAAGGCLTCAHPCQEQIDLPPAWPHRPLTRAPLPLEVIPPQRQADSAPLPPEVTAPQQTDGAGHLKRVREPAR